MFDSSGNATVQVERPLGSFTTVGSGVQSCKFNPCSQGGAASIEASFPLSAFNPTGALIGLQTETHASQSPTSQVKDCVPGSAPNGACNGYFNLDRHRHDDGDGWPRHDHHADLPERDS